MKGEREWVGKDFSRREKLAIETLTHHTKYD